ncbi:MAG: Hpt domain-containing protein [Candidatus Hydrogenedentes bacterium]|nr:Hpt domain-containing protein [Candidatus Hydrogenedentota bacterium]
MESNAGAGGDTERGVQAGLNACGDKCAALAVFDRDDFARRMGHNRELCARVLEVFMRETPRQLERLNQAVAAHDAPAAQHVAHSIKGAAASVSAEVVHQAAYDVETAAHECAIDEVRRKLVELEWAFASFLEVLSRDSL